MATAYKSAEINAGTAQVFKAGDIAEFVRPFSFAITTGFTTGDTVALCPIPNEGGGAVMIGYEIEMPVLDTGTSLTWNLGDDYNTTNSTAFVSGTTAARTATGPAIVDEKVAISGATNIAGVQRGVFPRNYTPVTSGNSTTGGVKEANLLLTIVTGPQTAVTTNVTITGYIKLQNAPAANPATHTP